MPSNETGSTTDDDGERTEDTEGERAARNARLAPAYAKVREATIAWCDYVDQQQGEIPANLKLSTDMLRFAVCVPVLIPEGTSRDEAQDIRFGQWNAVMQALCNIPADWAESHPHRVARMREHRLALNRAINAWTFALAWYDHPGRSK